MNTTHPNTTPKATNHLPTTLVKRMYAAIDRGTFVDMDTELNALGLQNPSIYNTLNTFFLRQYVIKNFGFAIPGPGTAFPDAVRPYGPILEIGAGLGTLGRLLRAAGIDCISTDPHPWDHAKDVLPMDGQTALSTYPGRTILCAWPGYQTSWLTDLLKRFAPGQHLLLVGEPRNGCTGDDALFDVLDRWTSIPMPPNAIWRWNGIHDHLGLWVAP